MTLVAQSGLKHLRGTCCVRQKGRLSFLYFQRNQLLVIEGLDKAAIDLRFAMLGVDSDNDSAFMNQNVYDYCQAHGLVQTRSRAYKKNDQAWVEQKNGSIVRCLVGYGRLSGAEATHVLAQLYAASRLFINFFQPSFKLKSKTRRGARVSKVYHAPATPCERLLAHDGVSAAIKAKLIEQFMCLDPVRLLQEVRISQQRLSDIAAHGPNTVAARTATSDVAVFLASVSSAWKDGEARPTHRQRPTITHWWRSRVDPFADAWPIVEGWLIAEPSVSVSVLMDRLAVMIPDAYARKAPLRTLQRRVREWHAKRVQELILGSLRKAVVVPIDT